MASASGDVECDLLGDVEVLHRQVIGCGMGMNGLCRRGLAG